MCFKKIRIIFVVVLSAISAIFSISPLAFCSDTSTIETAETDVRDAFIVVLDAEKAGANITHLMSRLQDAGNLLVEAENYYLNGDINQSTVLAALVRSEAYEIAGEAASLESLAIVDSLNVFWLTLIFSMVGGLVFVLVLILVWFWFKARYMKKLLRAKPEVIRC